MEFYDSTVIRFNVLAREVRRVEFDCKTVCIIERKDIVEYWFECSDLYGLISLLKNMASYGIILAIGGLNGVVYGVLPRTFEEFLNSLLKRVVLEPGMNILVQPCSNNLVDAIAFLSQYSSKLRVKTGSNYIWVTLTKPIDVNILFDNKLRVLKPIASPPQLFRYLERTRGKSARTFRDNR